MSARLRDPKENFHTVGLPDAAVRESRQRIRAALKNCGSEFRHTNHHQPCAGGHQERRLRLRPAHGHGNHGSIRRPDEERLPNM